MKARMIVPSGNYEQGEIVRGATADTMVEQGFAVMVEADEVVEEDKPKASKAKTEKKALKGAPENKSS